jgi:hypothetical protein
MNSVEAWISSRKICNTHTPERVAAVVDRMIDPMMLLRLPAGSGVGLLDRVFYEDSP